MVTGDEYPEKRQRAREAKLAQARLAVFNRAGFTHKHPDRAPLLARYEELEQTYLEARRDRTPSSEVKRLMAARDAALLAAKESGIHMRDLGIAENNAKRLLKRARASRAVHQGQR
jgi:hypothetical protein